MLVFSRGSFLFTGPSKNKHASSFAIATGVVEALYELAGQLVCKPLQKFLIQHTRRLDCL